MLQNLELSSKPCLQFQHHMIHLEWLMLEEDSWAKHISLCFLLAPWGPCAESWWGFSQWGRGRRPQAPWSLFPCPHLPAGTGQLSPSPLCPLLSLLHPGGAPSSFPIPFM